MLEIASDLVEQGMYLFPLRRNGKLPVHKGWREEATLDLDQVACWIKQGYNLGVDTEKSGLAVIDTDQKNGIDGDGNFRALIGEHEFDTFTVETPTGGRHYYFRGDPIKSTAGVIAPGVDVKSKGGYVVAPGSTIDGQAYRIINKG